MVSDYAGVCRLIWAFSFRRAGRCRPVLARAAGSCEQIVSIPGPVHHPPTPAWSGLSSLEMWVESLPDHFRDRHTVLGCPACEALLEIRVEVTIDEKTTALLVAHREACAKLATKCGASVSAKSFLFLHEVDFSRPWRPNYATLAFTCLRDELGLDGVKLHHLRHSSATQLPSAGIDICVVSGRLDHANASSNLDFYGQFLQAADERAADALGALLWRQSCHVPAWWYGTLGGDSRRLEGR
jgi:hypothetical protein